MGRIDGGLRAIFRQNLLDFDWTSIESGSTASGIPDSNYCTRKSGRNEGVEGWIEYKLADGWAVTLRPEQIGWLARRTRHGGRTYIAVRQRAAAGPRREERDALWLLPGGLAVEARTGGLRPLGNHPLVRTWHGGPSGWDWRAIAVVLTS